MTHRIQGRDVFGDAWEASPLDGGTRGAVASLKTTGDRHEALSMLDATSATRLGAFLLARGLGAADGSVVAGTLVLVAPGPVSDVELDELRRRVAEVHSGPVVVLAEGWRAEAGPTPEQIDAAATRLASFRNAFFASSDIDDALATVIAATRMLAR